MTSIRSIESLLFEEFCGGYGLHWGYVKWISETAFIVMRGLVTESGFIIVVKNVVDCLERNIILYTRLPNYVKSVLSFKFYRKSVIWR